MSVKAWLRDLQVSFTSESLGKTIVFGNKWKSGKDDLNISITGTKYLSSTKDNFTVRISNLTYSELVQLIMGQYYVVEIKAGYRSNGAQTIFSGAVIYMSYEKQSRTDNTVIVLCGSKLVATYGQSRMNMSLNSGINMYSAIKFLCERAGISNSNVDKSLKNNVIRETVSISGTISQWLESFSSANNLIVSSDSSYGNDVTVISPYKTNNRVVNMTSDRVVLVDGYPKLTSDGLTMSLLPTFNFMPMDVIMIDNSIIDISTSSTNSSSFNSAMYMDEDGKYVITQIDYSLENRGSTFQLSISAKARSLYSNIASFTGR